MGTTFTIKVLYATISLAAIALVSLVIFMPVMLRAVDQLQIEWEQDFLEVKKLSNDIWGDLQKMGAKTRTPRDRLRRQYDNFASGYGANQYSNNNYDDQGGYDAPEVPAYGYGLARLKCCCAMKNIDYNGEHRNLPISYKCPIGKKGAPGPSGEPGEAGRDGQPGYDGEDYPTVPEQNSGVAHFDQQAAAFDEGYGLITSKQQSPPQSKCEACPRGPPGPPGPKGIPGVAGLKGDHGIQGIHGIPGVPGNIGTPGNVGVRGKSGRGGIPGPRGADGQRGGKGLPGKRGETGYIGVPGPRGVSGPTGSSGKDGRHGLNGKIGPKGQRGLDGVDGPQGPIGPPGIDAGYCKCPDRVHDVGAPVNYDLDYRPGSYPSSNTFSSAKDSKLNYNTPSSATYNAKAPAVAPKNEEDVSGGSSYQLEQKYGNANNGNYNPMKVDPRSGSSSSSNYYTKEITINDLPTSQVSIANSGYQYQQGATPGQQNPPVRSQLNYNYSQAPKAVSPSQSVSTAASYSPQQEEEYPFYNQDWNDRRRRLQRQRTRYVGRS